MAQINRPGQIIILNGVPRSGKSSIVKVIQETFDGPWVNLGVDVYKERIVAKKYGPAIGLRPGGEAPDLEPLVVLLYAAMYESVAVHSRLGLNVVVDVGHHDNYSIPRGILVDSAQRLNGLPVLFVGVHCPIETIMERRRKTWGNGSSEDEPVPDPIQLWQRDVHEPGIYDLEVDTSLLSPEECAKKIQRWLESGTRPSAFEWLAR
jgi:chloramphenicol 3-O phosphotransferase